METLTLLRLKSLNATPGVLLTEKGILCFSLELPWRDNAPNVSCIPDSVYFCKRVNKRETTGGMKIETTFEVENVSGRYGILFHIGNQVGDTEGCILLGKGINIDRRVTLAYSRVAFTEFLDYFAEENEFKLIVKYEG